MNNYLSVKKREVFYSAAFDLNFMGKFLQTFANITGMAVMAFDNELSALAKLR